MLHLLPRLRKFTNGERSLMLANLVVSVFGFAFGLIVVLRLDQTAFFARGLTLYEFWILASGAIGAYLALRFSRDRLGRDRLGETLYGMLIITLSGPIIAGTLALPLYGTMFGPMTLGIIFWVAPITAALWFTSLTGVHFLMREWHQERDSIFGPGQQRDRFALINGLLRDLRIR